MTEQSQGRGRWNEAELRNNPPRIPRMPTYQARGQLPMTLLALVVILTAAFAYWILSI